MERIEIFLFQMKVTNVHITSEYISTSLHVSGNYVPIIGRIYCIYLTLVGATHMEWKITVSHR